MRKLDNRHKEEIKNRILALENKCMDLQHQIYQIRGKNIPTNVNPYSTKHK